MGNKQDPSPLRRSLRSFLLFPSTPHSVLEVERLGGERLKNPSPLGPMELPRVLFHIPSLVGEEAGGSAGNGWWERWEIRSEQLPDACWVQRMPNASAVGNFCFPPQKPENHKAGRHLLRLGTKEGEGERAPIRLVKQAGHSRWRGGGNIRRGVSRRERRRIVFGMEAAVHGADRHQPRAGLSG